MGHYHHRCRQFPMQNNLDRSQRRRAFEKSLFHSVVFKLPVMVVNVQPVGILFGKYTNANTNAIHTYTVTETTLTETSTSLIQ